MENFLGDLLPALSNRGIKTAAVVHRSPGEPVTESLTKHDTAGSIFRATCYGSILYAPISPGFPLLLHKAIKQFKPDIIHFHVPNTSAFWPLLLIKTYKIPWVIHWHADVVSSKIDRRLAAAYSLYRPFEQKLLSHAAAIITTSQTYLDSSIPLTKWKEKCTVIPLGLNPKRLAVPDHKALKKAESIWGNGKTMRVLSVGRLTYYKGHEVLIRAAAQTDGVKVIIVGKGDKRGTLEKLITKLQVQDRVSLSGFLPENELQALLATSDCFCLPSIERTEAFGLVLLEAMHFSKMLLVSYVAGSGMTWVVQDGKTGSLFSVGKVEELASLLKDFAGHPEERKSMGLAGKNRFETTFHIDRTAEQTIQLYQNILSAG